MKQVHVGQKVWVRRPAIVKSSLRWQDGVDSVEQPLVTIDYLDEQGDTVPSERVQCATFESLEPRYDGHLDKFKRFLVTHAHLWSSELTRDHGLRLIEVGGSVLRAVIADDKVEAFWQSVTKKLPPDALLMDCGGDIMLQSVSSDAYRDAVYLCFGSKEWSKGDDGGIIEKLDVVFDRSEIYGDALKAA